MKNKKNFLKIRNSNQNKLHGFKPRFKNKKAFEMSFDWIFAIIAGIFILFLAIFGATRVVNVGEAQVGTETSASLISLIDPLETGLASGKSTEINFKKESKIYFRCDSVDNDPFGKQSIAFSEKTFGNKYGLKSSEVPFVNKYVFSNDEIEGKNLFIFSKPFYMPFKVADITVIGVDKYCFINAPSEIKYEIEKLKINSINFSDDKKDCSGKTVCFGVNNCDINVLGACNEAFCKNAYEFGKVVKTGENREEVNYIGALLYGAIFSSEEIYNCNVNRLMKKISILSMIYETKAKTIELKGCQVKSREKLLELYELTKKPEVITLLSTVLTKSKELNDVNKGGGSCKLYNDDE